MLGTRRTRTTADIPGVSGSRPVMLVTFDVPFEPEATELAVDAAVESGQRLIIVNVAEVALGPISLAMKYEYVGTQEVEDALRAPAALARSLAVEVERLRLCSPRPIEALLELVAERAPGLLVVGPDRERAEAADLREADEADPRAGSLPRLAARLSAQRALIGPASRASRERAAACSSSSGTAPAHRGRVEPRRRPLDADDRRRARRGCPDRRGDRREVVLALLPRLGVAAPANVSSSSTSCSRS